MHNLRTPSVYQIDDTVNIDFGNSHFLKNCQIVAVKFTNYGKTLYDIQIPVGFDDQITIIKEVDSLLISAEIK
jgi:hypothetical protein